MMMTKRPNLFMQHSPLVALVCPRGTRLPPGTEITISYGDKSNEELLFLYGFALKDNPADTLMVACPLPPDPADWDQTLPARLQLLRNRGLAPQFFLPGAFLDELGAQQAQGGRSRTRWWWVVGWLLPWTYWLKCSGNLGSDSGSSSKGHHRRATAGKVLEGDLPPGVMETLEALVMEPQDLEAELEREEQGSLAGRGVANAGASEGELSSFF
jgi:hypothetical protein